MSDGEFIWVSEAFEGMGHNYEIKLFYEYKIS